MVVRGIKWLFQELTAIKVIDVHGLVLLHFIPRERHVRERLSLESSLDCARDELQSVQKRLDYEDKWRDSAEGTHKRLLQEKAELQSRLVTWP